jgi:CRISPR/Cas system-associated endonuclease Cas1
MIVLLVSDGRRRAGNRNASHPVNAILNYAYTVLQGEIQIEAVAEGYDPTIGIMHEGRWLIGIYF